MLAARGAVRQTVFVSVRQRVENLLDLRIGQGRLDVLIVRFVSNASSHVFALQHVESDGFRGDLLPTRLTDAAR